jgi:hypothetical protein
VATEWLIEAKSGGTCVVRLVMSGFGPGPDWDDEVDGLRSGMRLALSNLQRFLAGGGPALDPQLPLEPRSGELTTQRVINEKEN